MEDAARRCLLVFNVDLPPTLLVLAGLPSLQHTRCSCVRLDTVDGASPPAPCIVVIAEGVTEYLLDRDGDGMVVRVGDVRHEEADGDAARRGAHERQALDQEGEPTWPPWLPGPDPRDAAAQGPTLPRLLPGSVGAPVGGPGGDAYDAEGAAHHAYVHGQELKPWWHKFGVEIRRSCHDAESG